MKAADRYELNVLFSGEPSKRDRKYGVAVIKAFHGNSTAQPSTKWIQRILPPASAGGGLKSSRTSMSSLSVLISRDGLTGIAATGA